MIDFEAARLIVADSVKVRALYPVNDFMVGDYGWESDAEFQVVAGTRKDVTGEGDFDQLTLDAPVVFVAKPRSTDEVGDWRVSEQRKCPLSWDDCTYHRTI